MQDKFSDQVPSKIDANKLDITVNFKLEISNYEKKVFNHSVAFMHLHFSHGK